MKLHLVRLPLHRAELIRFAFAQGIRQEDETFGYSLHAWLCALFGKEAPKPFRFFERRSEVLAYANRDAETLLDYARSFAPPLAWSVLDLPGVASKPMPEGWRQGQRLRVEVLACPVSRKDDGEKDVYLRALDRLGSSTPPRGEVYASWFIRQWRGAVHLESVQLLGMMARARLLRRMGNGPSRLRIVERPQVLFGADAVIVDSQRFAELLARGIGRHRAFGFGMVLLSPPR